MRRFASRYMTRFSCIGSQCEDTCCSGDNWHVPVSESDYRRVEQALAEKPEGDRFRQAFRVTPLGGPVFAVLNPGSDGKCALLDGERLCSLHQRFGEAVLPDVCSAYPRAVGRAGDRLELSGLLSCPEIARLLLLADDSTDPVPVEESSFGRMLIDRQMDPDPEDVYLQGFVRVRAALLTLMARREYPLRSRLFFCAFLADRLRPFYHRGAPVIAEQELDRAIAPIMRPSALAELHAQLSSVTTPASIAPAIIIGVIEARLQKPCAPVFTRLVAEVTGDYLREAGIDESGGLRALGPERLWLGHFERRQVSPEIEQRIDQYFSNYCANYLTHDWHLEHDQLLHHLQILFARVALLRFLLLGRPSLRGVSDLAVWDRAAVEVFYAVARALEHNLAQRSGLADALTANGFVTLPHAVSLLQL